MVASGSVRGRRSIPPPLKRRRKRLAGGSIELIEVTGRGGMSAVWRAWMHGSNGFRRPVAVKHMFPQLAEQKIYCEMFFEEARVGALLQDPNIPQVLQYLVEGGDHYIVMEWIEGIDLATYLRYSQERLGERMPWPIVAAIGVGVLRGLAAAHERVGLGGGPEPIVHRDVSPHNVMISAKGPAKLIDFGLSFARDRTIDDTDPGFAKGKLAYLSPEIARGERPSPASDLFAAGSVLWEALVGRRLFGDANRYEAYRRLSRADVPPLRKERKDVPAALAALIERALALDPSRRFATAREMAKQLGDVLKASISGEDLYATLARTVARARTDLELGYRTQDASHEQPVVELESSLVELLDDDGAPRRTRTRG
jgi:eukaryotic-like serine/threonine-protein kinase